MFETDIVTLPQYTSNIAVCKITLKLDIHTGRTFQENVVFFPKFTPIWGENVRIIRPFLEKLDFFKQNFDFSQCKWWSDKTSCSCAHILKLSRFSLDNWGLKFFWIILFFTFRGLIPYPISDYFFSN